VYDLRVIKQTQYDRLSQQRLRVLFQNTN